jgi:hypothetical protein
MPVPIGTVEVFQESRFWVRPSASDRALICRLQNFAQTSLPSSAVLPAAFSSVNDPIWLAAGSFLRVESIPQKLRKKPYKENFRKRSACCRLTTGSSTDEALIAIYFHPVARRKVSMVRNRSISWSICCLPISNLHRTRLTRSFERFVGFGRMNTSSPGLLHLSGMCIAR